MQLKDFDADLFLRDVWQKKPLLIRNAWDEWSNPLAPDDLAGLACEDSVEARIVRAGRSVDAWACEQGPFEDARFSALSEEGWTLLVQAVDHLVPDVAALMDPFRFIPNWRIDDVMVSYATDGGGVGPHFDQYDVFLVQGLGRRRWRLGGFCDADTPLLPHDDLRLLRDFEATMEWVLEPGDILYVPPRMAHDGVAVGSDCMTYSIGFRAPSRSELMAHWCDHLLAGIEDDDRYEDVGLSRADNPGEISAQAIARLHAMATEQLQDRAAFARWFGQYNSSPKYCPVETDADEAVDRDELRARLADGNALVRNPASRFSFIRRTEDVLLFVDGVSFECIGEAGALAQRICAQDPVLFDARQADEDAMLTLLVSLIAQGSLGFEEADED
ncbi:cupin domain-containing protein [Sphingobium subterraneum]|uniref:50S ribosomal protein L16 3-hydroxylase n=1 Tax=Sphingobium subterraneum TaxID=627688 RepID=A0A841J066_9SPHN|nr:cupin domain-containing protein [Sphingobium subterraneum]MBB6124237.1 50S ribosomal protein L16 3-hydroxylase [Sphingobium subterraneum]